MFESQDESWQNNNKKKKSDIKSGFKDDDITNTQLHETVAYMDMNSLIIHFRVYGNEMNHKVRGQKMYLRTCVPSEDSDQPAHSRSLIRIFTGRIFDSQGCKVSSCEERRFWSDCVDSQADQSLRCVLMSEGTFANVAHKYVSLSKTITRRETSQKGPYIICKQRPPSAACTLSLSDLSIRCPPA